MIVVTGATGVVGRETVQQLLDAGHDVTAISRRPEAAALPPEVRVVGPDAAWAGDAALLSPRAVGNDATDFLAMAAQRGVRRVVVISAATVQYPVGEPRFIEGFKAVESAARDSGLAWTFLRCSDFDANAVAWIPQIRAGGPVRGAYPDAATSPIHERDIAAVALRALVEPDHAGQTYVLTGPESLTQSAKARIIGEAIAQPMPFAEVPADQVRAAMLAQGLHEEIPARLLGSLADYAREAGPTTDTVSRLLGRPALTFATWAAENAAAFKN